MPDYINIIIFVGGCSIFVASLLYGWQVHLLRKQTAEMERRFAARQENLRREREAQTMVGYGDRLSQEGRVDEAGTLYKIAVETDPSLSAGEIETRWHEPVKARPERMAALLERLSPVNLRKYNQHEG